MRSSTDSHKHMSTIRYISYIYHFFLAFFSKTTTSNELNLPSNIFLMSKKIEILLLKPLPPKGNAGDVIEVKTHFALHVLIPQGTAVVYDKQTKNQRESQMKKVAANKAELQKHVVDMVAAVEKAG